MNLLYVALIIFVLYMSYRNFKMMKRVKGLKGYQGCYKALVTGGDEAYEYILNYMEGEKNVAYVNKAKLFKLYLEMEMGKPYVDTLEDIDLSTCFFVNGKFSKDETIWNSEGFLWLIIDMVKAKAIGDDETVEKIFAKVDAYEELKDYLEYQLTKNFDDALLGKEDKGVEFFNNLIKGEYPWLYDKRLIGFYKRFAEAILAYLEEPIGDFEEEDLGDFVKTLVGKILITDLGMYERFHKEDEENEEENLGDEIVQDEEALEIETEDPNVIDVQAKPIDEEENKE